MTSPFYFTSSAGSGRSLIVSLWAKASTNAVAADLTLNFSAETATFSSFEGPSGWSTQTNAGGIGQLLIALFDGTFSNPVGTSNDGLLGKITFTIKEGASSVSVSLSDTYLTTSNGTEYAPSVPDAYAASLEAQLAIATADGTKSEGQSGSTAYTFTVTRSGDTSVSHSANWAVTGTGSNPAVGTDFVGGVLPSGVASFGVGETSKSISVLVSGDTGVEPDEGFAVTLTSPSTGAVIATAAASGTITNDDASAPRAQDDAYTMLRGVSLDVTQTRGILANDTGASTASVVTPPSHGSLTLQADGSFRYTPSFSFSGIDQFTYRASSSGATTDDADVTLHVIPVVVGATTTLGLVSLTPQEQIAATYVAFFGRGADAGGFNFWVDQFAKNLPTQGAATLFANIASSFAVGDEAKAIYPFLANPTGASNAQIEAFLSKVYDNLFNRTPDAEGLAYWRGEIQNTLKAGQFVGSVLVNIMSGAQNSPAGQDITTLMSKVAVSLEYVQQQQLYRTEWTWADDQAEAMALLDPVGDVPETLLIGMANAQSLVLADIMV
jgi:hypothetical protein